eukprot:PITA_09739
MEEEIGAIEKSDTWELVNLLQGKKVIGVKWVYKTKRNVVAVGMETVHITMVIVTQHKQKMYQIDVKSTFLNGLLKEEVYVAQPPSYEVEGKEDKVYQLRKALYGLKQAPRAWYSRIDAYLLENDFSKCDRDPTLYIKESDGVKQIENGIFISQEKYVEDILERFKMQNSKPAPTPTVMGLKLSKEDYSNNVNPTLYKSMIGNLMYLTITRLDIMYAVSLVSRFMEIPTRRISMQ